MDTTNMKKPLTLKERREKIKKEKLDKKISRLAENKLKDIDKTMKDIVRLSQKETTECVNGFVEGIFEEDEKKMKRFSERFINVDRRLHEVIKNDKWTEEKSYETFDMLVEMTIEDIGKRMMLEQINLDQKEDVDSVE